MPRFKKERKNVNTQHKSLCLKNITPDLYDSLKNVCDIRGCSMTHLILDATRLHVNKVAMEIAEERGLQNLIKK